MLRGYRRTVYAVGLIALAAIAGGGGLWIYSDANRLQSAYEHQAKEKAQRYADRADIAVKRHCGPLLAQAARDCRREEYAAARQGQHDEYDLQAQLVTSVWTKAMGLAALVGMVVGIFGVGLIYVTFRETRRAAKSAENSLEHARDTAKRQLRAYLVAKSFRISGVLVDHTPRVMFELKNVGQTPAYEVRIWWEIRTLHAPISEADTRVRRSLHLPWGRQSRAIIGAGEPVEISIPYRAPVGAEWARALHNGKWTLLAFGVVSYRDVFKRRRLLTFKMFLSHEHLEDNGWGKLFACNKGCAAN